MGKKTTTGNPHCYFTVTPGVQQEWFWNLLLTMLKLTWRLYVWFKFNLITLSVSFLFSCGGGGRGEGRGHLKCLRLQPGAGAGEKLSKRGSLLILLVLKAIKAHKPHHSIKKYRVPRTVIYQTKQSKWLKYIQCTITGYS